MLRKKLPEQSVVADRTAFVDVDLGNSMQRPSPWGGFFNEVEFVELG